MPVLDVEVWNEGGLIRHSFYKKSVSCPFLIMEKSAINERTKRDTLLQEGLRRLRNTDIYVSEDERNEILSEYCNSMRISGYPVNTRFHIIKGILTRQKQIETEISEGIRRRYRSGKEIRNQKINKLGNSINTWFLKGGNTCTMTVQCTPGAVLKDRVQKAVGTLPGPDGGFTKIIEESGSSVMSGLKVSNPFNTYECKFQDKCSSDSKTDCTDSRCVYQVECKLCQTDTPDIKTLYIGTTGCSLHKRLKEHQTAIARQDKSNALAKHMMTNHQNKTADFCTKIVDKQKFNLQRFVSESLYIEKNTKSQGTMILNSKSEWGRQKLTRLVLLDNT